MPLGLLARQAAILRDAAAELAGIESQMAGGARPVWVIHHGQAAVGVLERTVRLLGAQRAAMLECLADLEPGTGESRRGGPAVRPEPSWEVTLLARPAGGARARSMGRVRFEAADATQARKAAEAALADRSAGEPRWSLGLLRPLTPNAPGTQSYAVTFAAWETSGDRFVRRDVHRCDVWATDATSARRLAAEEVQAVPGYLPAWRVRRVARTIPETPSPGRRERKAKEVPEAS